MIGNTTNQFLVITHSPAFLHNLLFEKEASLIYVQRSGDKSVVNALDTKKIWTDTERYKLSYQIDTRIFFARHVLLGEGESDKDFLETVSEMLGFDPDTYEDIIVNAEGKNNLPKYRNLLETFGIPYVVVADGDSQHDTDLQSRAASYGSRKDYTMIDSSPFPATPTSNVFFFKQDVEDFMRGLDSALYGATETSLTEGGVKVTKPIFMHSFVRDLLKKSPNALDATIRPLLGYSFDVQHRIPAVKVQ